MSHLRSRHPIGTAAKGQKTVASYRRPRTGQRDRARIVGGTGAAKSTRRQGVLPLAPAGPRKPPMEKPFVISSGACIWCRVGTAPARSLPHVFVAPPAAPGDKVVLNEPGVARQARLAPRETTRARGPHRVGTGRAGVRPVPETNRGEARRNQPEPRQPPERGRAGARFRVGFRPRGRIAPPHERHRTAPVAARKCRSRKKS